jgi:hypothetical protein
MPLCRVPYFTLCYVECVRLSVVMLDVIVLNVMAPLFRYFLPVPVAAGFEPMNAPLLLPSNALTREHYLKGKAQYS